MKLLDSRITAPVSCSAHCGGFSVRRFCTDAADKAIVLAWDGAVPSFVHELLRLGKLPNLEKLIAGGAFADDVIPVFPPLRLRVLHRC